MILRVYVNLPEGNGNGDFKIFSHGPVEIVDLPIKHGGSFHSFLYVYQAGYMKQVPSSVIPTSHLSFVCPDVLLLVVDKNLQNWLNF